MTAQLLWAPVVQPGSAHHRCFISAFCLWEFHQSWKSVLLLLLSLLHREKAWQVWNHNKNWAVTENWTRCIQSFNCFMFLLPGNSSTCCPQPELLFAAVTGSSFIIRANLSTFPIFFFFNFPCMYFLSQFLSPALRKVLVVLFITGKLLVKILS